MSVKKVFWEDPYCRELTAQVMRVEGEQVFLDQTIAYPFSGGQICDMGTIGGWSIVEGIRYGKDISYTLKGHDLTEGQTVLIHIDWERRYRIMRLHFAAELVLELVYQLHEKHGAVRPEKIGAHITAQKARIDFKRDRNISELFPDILSEVVRLVDEDREIISRFSDEREEQRYWEIDGFARVACGGTHLRRTREVGQIILRRDNVGRQKERIEIMLKNEE